MKSLKTLVARNLKRAGAVAGAVALSATNAMAAVDTTAILADIDAAETAVLAIGAAVVLIFLGINLYKWVRRSF